MAFFAVTVLGMAAASASHYRLVDVPDVIEAAHHAALAKAGIQDTKVLYEAIVDKHGRRTLASKTRIPVRTLAKWARILDLMQISGVGPKMVRLLNAAGIGTLTAFQKADAVALHPKLRAVNRGGRYSELVPPVDVLRGWIEAAAKIRPRLDI